MRKSRHLFIWAMCKNKINQGHIVNIDIQILTIVDINYFGIYIIPNNNIFIYFPPPKNIYV